MAGGASRGRPETLSRMDRLIARHGAESALQIVAPDGDPDALAEAETNWDLWARPNQLGPTEGKVEGWQVWLALAGRGWGKTRTGAEWVRKQAESGNYRRIGIFAPTDGDARKVLVEGESGIMAHAHPAFRPSYEPGKKLLTWPNGCQGFLYSGEKPDRARGPQHDLLWFDELMAYKHLQAVWDMAMFGLRLGPDPRALVTTTPRPVRMLRDLVRDPETGISVGTTFDNLANLAERYREIIQKYRGTRLGRQELEAVILSDYAGTLWPTASLDAARVEYDQATGYPIIPDMKRIGVGIDPAVSNKEDSDEWGIVGAGIGVDQEVADVEAPRGRRRAPPAQAYVLADYSMRGSPDEVARRAILLYRQMDADVMVAEVNNGGDMVEAVIRNACEKLGVPMVNFKKVHATRGKALRAEPIAMLYEQGRVKHAGNFPKMEEQMAAMCTGGYSGEGSPDRLDALVWILWELTMTTGFYMTGVSR